MKPAEAYAKVTQRLIAELESGTVPWHKPWRTAEPTSIHGNKYRGINAVILHFLNEHESNIWLTYNQAKERGAQVRKGSKGMPIILWKVSAPKDAPADSGDEVGKSRLFATTYTVFNSDQCDNLELPKKFAQPATMQDHEDAETIAARYASAGGPVVKHHGARAYYRPKDDTIAMPPKGTFSNSAEYYSTLFHELGHSTGHASRLARLGITNFDGFASHQYSAEELVAEFTAAFLCNASGTENVNSVNNSAAYLRHWLTTLRDEPGILVKAASQAQKAADLILGVKVATEA